MENKINFMKPYIQYWRNPTKREIKFGYGAIHYKDFPISKCIKEDGKIKQWLICKDDGLRYNLI